MAWTQLTIELPGARVALAEAILEAAEAQALTCLDAADQPILEPGPAQTPLWGKVRLQALFPHGADLSGLRVQFARALGEDLRGWTEAELADRDWSRAWMDDYRPMRFGRRLWVVPHGMTPPDPEAVNVRLDPGLAFGTGTHPTTALCLEWLDAAALDGRRVVDYGCGSGILAVAALRLGAEHAVAIDNDPQALTATAENAANNGVDRRLAVLGVDAPAPEPADIVLANILSGIIIELAQELIRLVRPGGILVLSGILEHQAPAVMAAFGDAVRFQPPSVRDGWVRLAGDRVPVSRRG
jgi:ribosomal protein L11 methyltransferase